MSPENNESWPESSGRFKPSRATRKEAFPKRIVASLAFVIGCLPRRRSGRRALTVLTIVMALAGVGLLAYPVWTDIVARNRQHNLQAEFRSKQEIELYRRREIAVGGALTRLKINRMGACADCKVDVIVVEGITGNALRAGAGHYPETALPGEQGNVAIAGHRTGFGEPFRHLDALRPGDLIILYTPIGNYTYQVVPPFDGHSNPWVTHPRDVTVLEPTIDAELTLTTCDPPHTSLNRLIVRAKLIKSEVVA